MRRLQARRQPAGFAAIKAQADLKAAAKKATC
jgi:hypothetical protein